MCCRAAHPIAQDAQGLWGVVGWAPGCRSAAAVKLTGFRPCTPTPSFIPSKWTKSAMLMLRGSRRFCARSSQLPWGHQRNASRNFDAPFRESTSSFCMSLWLSGSLGSGGSVRRSSRTNKKPCKAPSLPCQDSVALPLLHPQHSFLPGIKSNWFPRHCSSRQARSLAGKVCGLPTETWRLGAIDWSRTLRTSGLCRSTLFVTVLRSST